MPIETSRISDAQAQKIIGTEEGQFADVKSVAISPANLTKTISAFANTDGGDLYIGIDELGSLKLRNWNGFTAPEDANGHLQIFEKLFTSRNRFSIRFFAVRQPSWPCVTRPSQ